MIIYKEDVDRLLREIGKVKEGIKKALEILGRDKNDKNGKENN